MPNGAVTIDIDDKYRTNGSSEEALCPFNRQGCILPEHLKPFECKLWPLRLSRKGTCLVLALVPTCPYIEKDLSKLRAAALAIAKDVTEYAKTHPEVVREYSADCQVIADVLS